MLETPQVRTTRYRMVIFIFLNQGIGILMCWSMFITAKLYFEVYKLYTSTSNYALFILQLAIMLLVSYPVTSCGKIFFHFGGQFLTKKIAIKLLKVGIFKYTVNQAMNNTINTLLQLLKIGNSSSLQHENGQNKISSQNGQESSEIRRNESSVQPSCISVSEYSTEEALDKVNHCPTVGVTDNAVDEVHIDSETARSENEAGNYQPASAHAKSNEDTIEKTVHENIDTVNLSLATKPFETKYYSNITRSLVAKLVVGEIHPVQRQYEVYPVGRMSHVPLQEERMKYEWLRLATFHSDMYTGNGNALSLARYGFYHDRAHGPLSTRCFLCDVHVSNWEHHDDVSELHRQRSPNCQFMEYSRPNGTSINDSVERSQRIQSSRSSNVEIAGCQQQPRGTTEMSRNAPVVLLRRSRRPDLSHGTTAVSNAIQNEVPQQNSASRRNLGIQETNPGHTGRTDPTITVVVNNPKHPDYLNIDTRVNSYRRWPDFLEQTARQMSEAGFFYLGIRDCVRCFWCGGGLQNWEQGEDPLLEHAKWFPHCKFLKQRVGERYEAAVQRHHQEHMAEHQRQEELTQRRNEHHGSGVPATTESVYREMGCPAVHTGRPVLNVRQETESNTRAAIGAGSALAAETYLPALGIFVPTSTLSSEASASTFRPASSTAATENQQSGSTTSTATYRGVSETRIQQTDSDIDQDVATLIEENRRLREALRCKICLDKDINIVLLPCGHLLCCKSCADRFQTCPVCRKIIEDKVKIYFSKC